MSVTFINLFEVPAGQEDEFLGQWREVNTYMRTKPGYVGHDLHRSLLPGARYRFVNTAVWASAEACRDAHDDGFRTLVAGERWRAFPSTPAIYEVVHHG
jgi:heme-degrading monooxygenase HmoA